METIYLRVLYCRITPSFCRYIRHYIRLCVERFVRSFLKRIKRQIGKKTCGAHAKVDWFNGDPVGVWKLGVCIESYFLTYSAEWRNFSRLLVTKKQKMQLHIWSQTYYGLRSNLEMKHESSHAVRLSCCAANVIQLGNHSVLKSEWAKKTIPMYDQQYNPWNTLQIGSFFTYLI